VPDLEHLTAADFVPLLHQRFRMDGGDWAPFEVELVDVSETDVPGPGRRQFSLMFRGGPNPPLPQRIYGVEHERIGRLELFLVPVGPDGAGQRYEAVFT
jgi:Domain of unknown function (DUF6916)